MQRIKLAPFMALMVGISALACNLADDDGDQGSRALLVTVAQEEADHALTAYSVCEAAPTPSCSAEEEDLTDALVALDDARGEALAFRASVTADCADGTSVSCSGSDCYAKDDVGCACVSNGQLQSVAACPTTAPAPAPQN